MSKDKTKSIHQQFVDFKKNADNNNDASGVVFNEKKNTYLASLQNELSILFDKAEEAILKLESDLAATKKPDKVVHNQLGDGEETVAISQYSDEKIKSRKKIEEKLAKLNELFDKAMTTGSKKSDFNALESFLKSIKS